MRRTTNPVDKYAAAVVAGRTPAGNYHRLACVRHLRDRDREDTEAFPFVFRYELADRFFRFAEQLKHYKGEWAGQQIVLQDHQKFRLGSVFGWIHADTELRRFRTAYNEIPRKNGKSLEAAAVMLYVTFYDGEPGAEGYCIATKRDQAKLVFNDCKHLVRSSPLRSRIGVHVSNLHREATTSKLEPLGADHDSTDGLNPSAVCADELHAYRDRHLLDVMETATGARRQPLFFKITTAGDDPVSPGGDEHDYACKILDGVLTDETYFAFISHADEGDDWLAERTWQKANPNWKVSVKPDDMRALAAKAKGIPAAAATFKQKRLNLWVNATAPCLSIEGWKRGQSQIPREEFEAALEHEPCFAGIDLASKLDLCALALVFPPAPGRADIRLILRIWTPEETLVERGHRDRAPYRVWHEQGWLQTTPGTRIDHQVVRETLAAFRTRYDIEQIGFDPWHADTLITQLINEDGYAETQVIPVPQTYAGMSSACLRIQADILAGMVDACSCPVTTWAVSNVVDQHDGKGNLMFAKGKSRGRIDPIIAATIGTSLFLRRPTQAVDDGVMAEWL